MLRYCANIILFGGTFLLIMVGKAQDPQFSQFFATRIYMNPAFTGNTHFGRVSSQFRMQWPGLGGYTTNGFYYDQNLPALKSGIGFRALQDWQSGGGLFYNKMAAMYAYGTNLTRKLYMRAGIAASYNTYSVNLTPFTFTDELLSGSTSTTDDYRFNKLKFFDADAGVLIYNESFWVGTSFTNLIQRGRQNPVQLSNPHPTKFSLHGGALIPVKKDIQGNFHRSVTLAAHYKSQLKYDQLDFGAYYGYSYILVGVWYRGLHVVKDNNATPVNNDAIILVFGVNHEGMRISYSFDLNVSPLHSYSYGAHELTLQFELWRKHKWQLKKNSKKQIPCPDFGPGWQKEDT
ncbi:MAG: type IX secretion system membrane protein PorP/SprF [Flavobacteriales bacterium]